MNCENLIHSVPPGKFAMYSRPCGKCDPCLAKKAADAIQNRGPLTEEGIEEWADGLAKESIAHGEEKIIAEKAGTFCEDEGCPHYGTQHSHPSMDASRFIRDPLTKAVESDDQEGIGSKPCCECEAEKCPGPLLDDNYAWCCQGCGFISPVDPNPHSTCGTPITNPKTPCVKRKNLCMRCNQPQYLAKEGTGGNDNSIEIWLCAECEEKPDFAQKDMDKIIKEDSRFQMKPLGKGDMYYMGNITEPCMNKGHALAVFRRAYTQIRSLQEKADQAEGWQEYNAKLAEDAQERAEQAETKLAEMMEAVIPRTQDKLKPHIWTCRLCIRESTENRGSINHHDDCPLSSLPETTKVLVDKEELANLRFWKSALKANDKLAAIGKGLEFVDAEEYKSLQAENEGLKKLLEDKIFQLERIKTVAGYTHIKEPDRIEDMKNIAQKALEAKT